MYEQQTFIVVPGTGTRRCVNMNITMLEVLRFLFKNPRPLFALATMLLVCCVHFMSD
jgi:hypothetical protein